MRCVICKDVGSLAVNCNKCTAIIKAERENWIKRYERLLALWNAVPRKQRDAIMGNKEETKHANR